MGKKKKLRIIACVVLAIAFVVCMFMFTGCSDDSKTTTNTDIHNTQVTVDDLVANQPTPTDLDYSLERYNLIRRAYWVNGHREKAMTLTCGVVKPLGYIVLFSSSGAVVQKFVVDGKVSSLNSYLTPNMKQEKYGGSTGYTTIETELPDIDGSYGENVGGIFFFTIEGKYVEWTGDFLYSDIPFTIDDPILKTE